LSTATTHSIDDSPIINDGTRYNFFWICRTRGMR